MHWQGVLGVLYSKGHVLHLKHLSKTLYTCQSQYALKIVTR